MKGKLHVQYKMPFIKIKEKKVKGHNRANIMGGLNF